MTVWNDPVSGGAAVLLLAVLMGFASAHKLSDIKAFRQTLDDYRLLPAALVFVTAVLVALSEATACVLLLLPATRALGAALTALLLGGYSIAIAINLARGRRDIACGCSWGAGGQKLSHWLVARNLALLPVALLAGGAWQARPLHLGDGFVVVMAGLCLLLCYHAADRLIANHTAASNAGGAA